MSWIGFENYMNANKQRSCAHGQIWSQHAEIQNSRVGFNMMEQINALVLTHFYLPACALPAFVHGYPVDYLCTSIYFHSTFVPNMFDSSS